MYRVNKLLCTIDEVQETDADPALYIEFVGRYKDGVELLEKHWRDYLNKTQDMPGDARNKYINYACDKLELIERLRK